MVEDLFQIPVYYNDIIDNKFITYVEQLFDERKSDLVNNWMPDNDTAATTYQSTPNVISGHSIIQDMIVSKVQTYLEEIGYTAPDCNVVDSWFNTYKQNDVVGYHNHGYRQYVSGIYYIEGTGESDNGQLCFESPSPFDTNIPHNSMLIKYQHRVYYNPIRHRMILFPSWLRHKVTPNYSGQPRSVLSFNVEVR